MDTACVLFLADAVFKDKPGGSRVVARELARGLAARGHKVTFLVARHTPDAPDDECHDGVRVVRYPGAGRGAKFVRAGRTACARLWAEQPFDVAHTHFAYAALGPLWSIPQSVPRVRTFHGPWDEEGWLEEGAEACSSVTRARALIKKGMRHQIEAMSLQRSDRVTVLSDCFGQQVTGRFGVPADRVRKIVGGVDVGRFMPANDKRAVRQALGLPEDRRLLLSVRRLARRMGLDNLIRSMPRIVARHPDTLLLIGGTGPDRERLERAIASTGLGGHVRLMGFLPEEQLAAYYQAADLFVLPTIALEGFGLATVEALACGTPVVGTPVGATPEILGELDGRLVTQGASPDALAERVLAFLGGGWARELTPERLSCFVRERYTWDRHVAATLALYEEVIAKARSQRGSAKKAFFHPGVVL